MKILLTGAKGFLGSALARHWKAAGHELAFLLRPTAEERRSDDDVQGLLWDFGPDVVVHTACVYGRRGEPALQLFDTNVRLGMVLLQGLAQAGRSVSFLNAGSTLAPDVSPYAMSKHQFSQWGGVVAERPGSRVQFLDLRLQHMYGPHDDAGKFTSQVLQACRSHQPELALTAGEQRRDFIFIDDVVSAFDAVLQARGQMARHEVIDVGTGEAPTVREFVERVHAATASTTRLVFGSIPYRPNEDMLCKADIQRLTRLGWAPRHSLGDGIRTTLQREQPA